MAQSAPLVIEYPESDGKPIGETPAHRQAITDTVETLADYLRDEPHTYVSGNMFVYYKPNDSKSFVAPDVFVVKGVRAGARRTYKIWEEGQAPVVIFEMTSVSTRKEDLEDKQLLYAELGVREYFLFDPLAEYLNPPLQGFRLRHGQYHPIRADGEGALLSHELALKLRREAELLRFIDTLTEEPLLTPAEGFARARIEAEAREAAEQRAQVAEIELERLRAELARLRG